MNMLRVFVDIECVHNKYNKLVIKELALAKLDGSSQSWVFTAPHVYEELPQHVRSVNSWLLNKHHGLSWFDGDVPICRLKHILAKHIPAGSEVYVKGSVKAALLGDKVNLSHG